MYFTSIVKELASFTLVIFLCVPAYAAYPSIKAFTVPPGGYSVKKDIVEVTNIAKTPPQGGRGICYAVAAAVFLNAENCRVSNLDCKHITADNLFSPAGLVMDGMVHNPNGKKKFDMEGWNAFNAINSVIYESYSAPSLACASKEKTMPGFTSDSEGVIKEYAMWMDMLKLYKKLSKEAKT